MILEAIGDLTGVRALIEFEAIRDSVCLQDFMQLDRIDP
jgi:hypothetical protein